MLKLKRKVLIIEEGKHEIQLVKVIKSDARSSKKLFRVDKSPDLWEKVKNVVHGEKVFVLKVDFHVK